MIESRPEIPTLADIREAAGRIKPYANRTPVHASRSLNDIFGGELFFKCENLQCVGAFKFRGACNAVFSMTDDETARGVATHSSGNHAAALALAARIRGIPSYIVMPENTPRVKIAAVRGYGAEITFCKSSLAAREITLTEVVKQTGAAFIHPYNNSRIIAGQGTAALEFIEDVHHLDLLLVPVSGGGLISGSSLVATALLPSVRVIGVEPEGADDASRSFKEGKLVTIDHPRTIADGLLASLCERTFSIIQKHVHDIVTVSDESIIQGMRLIWERMKLVIEPSAAVTIAALLEKKVQIQGKKVGIILSGGNVDLDTLPWM